MSTIVTALNFWGARFAGFALPMLVQSGIVIVLLWALNALLRKRVRATVRYALWILVLVKLVLPPTLTLPTSIAYWLPGHVLHPTVAEGALAQNPTASLTGLAPQLTGLSLPAEKPDPSGRRISLSAILFAAWLAGMSGLALWVGWRSLATRRMLRATAETPPDLQELLRSCSEQLGINRAISLRLMPSAGSPVIYGLFRPVVLVPKAMAADLEKAEMRSILLHELAHYRRGDLWINNLQIVLQLFYWYNPLLWLANHMIGRVREQAVDETVLVEMKDEAGDYPATLVRVARLVLIQPMPGIGRLGILESASGLRERIEHILSRPIPRSARIGAAALPILIAALLLLPMASKGVESDASGKPLSNSAAPMAPVDVGKNLGSGITLDLSGLDARMVTTAQQVQELENEVKADPEDVRSRLQLVSYYGTMSFDSESARPSYLTHLLWLIEHHPEGDYYSNPFLGRIDPAGSQKVRALWMKQIETHPGNAMILGSAAKFYLGSDRATAEGLLKKAEAADPQNPRWVQALAQLYALSMHRGPEASHAGQLALAEMEKLPPISPTGDYSNLDKLAKMAFAAGDLVKASKYAEALLQEAPLQPKTWNYGNAVFDGNQILGRIAVRTGQLDEAKRYLLESGKTPGSPQLNSFGPSMSLAKDLLEKGNKDTVQAYFVECAVFWKMAGPKLTQWSQEVAEGTVPSFGVNLAY